MINQVGFSPILSNKNVPQCKNVIAFKGAVADLEPKDVWKHFEEILPIYRESGHCQEIGNHLSNKLKNYGFKVTQQPDGTGQYNIVAVKNASKGSPIILQAHMDMVAVSDDNNPKKPIVPIINGDILRANGRTLGADDGLGLAMGLAIAEKTTTDKRFKDLPLKIVFTTDEETTMAGAKSLTKEVFASSKYLINLDSEESNAIVNGGSGSNTYNHQRFIPLTRIGDNSHKKITINLENASGGHSGVDIHKGRINPITAIFSELNKINTYENGVRLMYASGGDKDNSIPRSAIVQLIVPQDKSLNLMTELNNSLSALQSKYKTTDPKLSFSVEVGDSVVSPETRVVTPKFQEKLFRIVGREMLSGVGSSYPNGDSRTSQNIGVLHLLPLGDEGKIKLSVMSRSSNEEDGAQINAQTVSKLSELFGENVRLYSSFPMWQPRVNSDLTAMAVETYTKINNATPEVKVIHGGLENARFAKKYPNLDQISIGPDMFDIHSVNERTVISSMGKSYKLLENLLLRLKPEIMDEK